MNTQKQNNNDVVIREFYDSTGENKIIMRSNSRVQTLYLKLGGEKKKRLLGATTVSTRTFRIKRQRGKHLFLAGNAYGFNYHLLSTTKRFDTISLSDEHCDWKIPVKFILENGRYLMHKQAGFELQIFISLEQIEKFLVKPEENRRF